MPKAVRSKYNSAARLLAVAVLAVLAALAPQPRAGAQAAVQIRYTVLIAVVGDAPPNLLYNVDVQCLNFSRIVTRSTSGSDSFTQLRCGIARYYITGISFGLRRGGRAESGHGHGRIGDLDMDPAGRVTNTSTTTATTTTAPVLLPKISVDPVDFGNVLIGKSLTRQTTVRNTGPIPVAVRAASVPPPFSVTQPNCDLQPGATCTIDVTFSPTAPRQEQTLLTVNAGIPGAAGAAAQAPVTGTSEDRGDVLLSTPQFQPTPVGQTSPTVDATLTNVGSLPFNVKTVAVTPPFVSVGNKCPVLLQPNQTCTVQLAFRPTAPGPATGSISVSLAGATLLDLKGSLSAVAPVPPEGVDRVRSDDRLVRQRSAGITPDETQCAHSKYRNASRHDFRCRCSSDHRQRAKKKTST